MFKIKKEIPEFWNNSVWRGGGGGEGGAGGQ